jgi:mannose/fructose/N-acetylgalactosamine-specific phosphotransferase system component IIC
VRRAWIALAVVLAALIGFLTGSVVTLFVGVAATASSECDGVCFSKADEVSYVAYGVGALCAIMFAFAAHRFVNARFAKPS